jgi:type VI protein secretion system component Hcp
MKLRSLWTICLLFAAVQAAHAATDMLVSFGNTATQCAPPGMIIPGLSACPANSSFEAYEFSWSMSASAGSVSAVGNPTFTDLNFYKRLDTASAPLLMAMLQGKLIPQMLIAIYNTDGATPNRLLYTVLVKNAYVTGLSSSDTGVNPLETLTLGYESIQVTINTNAVDGTAGPSYSYGYNLITHQSN